jgi:hypothetical protein
MQRRDLAAQLQVRFHENVNSSSAANSPPPPSTADLKGVIPFRLSDILEHRRK